MAEKRGQYIVRKQVNLFIAIAAASSLAALAAGLMGGLKAAAPFLAVLLASPYISYIVVVQGLKRRRRHG